MTNKKKPSFLELMKYGFKNIKIIKAAKIKNSIRSDLYFTNMEIGKLDFFLRKNFTRTDIQNALYGIGRPIATGPFQS